MTRMVEGRATSMGTQADRREIGDEAVWSLSTAKPGNGVEQLRDHNLETYWQSDGAQPHLITLQFDRRPTISEIEMYLDYSLDESYTPQRIAIRCGDTDHDMKEVCETSFEEPRGWVRLPLTELEDDQSADAQDGVRAFVLQIAVLAMHQNGKDTHIRQLSVYAPRSPLVLDKSLPAPSTDEFWSYSFIR